MKLNGFQILNITQFLAFFYPFLLQTAECDEAFRNINQMDKDKDIEKLKCPLIWTPASQFSPSTKKSLIHFDGNEILISRTKLFARYKINSVVQDQIPDIGFGITSFENELLTNPHSCQFEWVPPKNLDFQFKVLISENDGETVGRTFINGKWTLCKIFIESGSCFFDENGKQKKTKVI